VTLREAIQTLLGCCGSLEEKLSLLTELSIGIGSDNVVEICEELRENLTNNGEDLL
jgi:hypothetical protein